MYTLIDSLNHNIYGLFNTLEQVVHFLYKHQEIFTYIVYTKHDVDVTWIVKNNILDKI